MIRLLNEQDRRETIALLSGAPALNLYLLGNVEALGFEEPFCQFWGDFEDGGAAGDSLRAILNRYMAGWAIYGQVDADWRSLGQIVDGHPSTAERLQDNPGGIEQFLPFIRKYRAERQSIQTLMSLSADDFQPIEPPEGITIRRATWADRDALVSFYGDAEQMTRSVKGVEQPLRRLRVWVALKDGRLLSAALTNAEIAKEAMVGGVYTRPDVRGRGLSQALCSALCKELLSVGKTPVLYWETPASGAVYQKIGFRTIGEWRSVRLAQNNVGGSK